MKSHVIAIAKSLPILKQNQAGLSMLELCQRAWYEFCTVLEISSKFSGIDDKVS